jgi:hypothetical protein
MRPYVVLGQPGLGLGEVVFAALASFDPGILGLLGEDARAGTLGLVRPL